MAWLVMAAICAIQMWSRVESLSESDKILQFPGQPKVSFQQFGGYISVDEKQDRALFYYLVEAESDPDSKPLVLWLNGGPGCSSIGAGAFCEHGPFKPRGQILVKNEYSWNKEANMLYLESPAGVGFSYSANKSFYSSVDDIVTARDNLVFLEHWFDKFPEYKNRDFFITGESYGGMCNFNTHREGYVWKHRIHGLGFAKGDYCSSNFEQIEDGLHLRIPRHEFRA